jgi:MGT family glycosyltransferase
MTDILTGNGKTILISAFDNILAHVGRSVLIANALRDMGYRVVFAGGGSYFKLVKDYGFETLPLAHLKTEIIIKSIRRVFLGVGLWTEDRLDEFVRDELRLYDELKPDLVLHDTRPSIPISARIAGIPCVSVTNAYLTWYGTTSWRIFPALLNPILEPIRQYLVIKPHNRIRRKYGLPKTRPREMMYDGDLILLADVPEYAPTNNLPDNYKYIGPLPWEPDSPLPSNLEEMRPDKPLIYFTLGSTGLPQLFQGVIEQLRGTDYQVVITTGWQIEPSQLEPLPTNIFATTYLPGNKMMGRSDLVICQAGNGTTYQALGAGVPVIGMPTHGEQWQNASLLEAQGAGFAMKPAEIHNIKPAIKRILDNGYYKKNAARFREIIAKYNGPQKAAELIHEFVNQNGSG